MSFWTKVQSLWLGVDTGAEQDRQSQLDAQIASNNQGLVDKGIWTPDQLAAANQDLSQSDTPDVQGAVDQAYLDGVVEGLQNDKTFLTDTVPNGISATLRGIVSSVFKAIPWQAWVIGAIVLFIYLGGLGILRRQIKNAS
jgi:hypothetical protein